MRTFALSSRSDQKSIAMIRQGRLSRQSPPFDVHAERAASLCRAAPPIPEARAIGYIPPESAWRIAAFSLTGELDPYLAAIGSDRRGLRRVPRLFDPVGADPRARSRGTYDGSHYSRAANAPVAGWPDGEPQRSAVDWRKEDVAAITALYHKRLAEFMGTITGHGKKQGQEGKKAEQPASE